MRNSGRILVLNDDPAAKRAAASLFAELPEGWKAHFSQSPDDAICQLSQVPVDMIFVDLSAGPLAGAQFLHEVWARHPQILRFLLSDSPRPDLMVTCALGPHQFLEKPLTGAALREALERASAMGSIFQNSKVQGLISRIRTFPARPTVYMEVMKELRSPEASPRTVGELVARDFAISSKLLQITNSAFFGFQQHVSDPAEAVLLLGLETTASLVLGIEAFSRLDNVKLLYFSTDQVWKHCQVVAQSARRITEYMTGNAALAHEAYTAALLHDIGKLALAVNLEQDYQHALNAARERNVAAWEVEKEMLGATHAEAGAYLLSLWGLPLPVVTAVAAHHLPPRELPASFSTITALHLANALEAAETSANRGFPRFELNLDYPAELGLQDHLDEFRNIASTAQQPAIGVTQIIRKKAIERRKESEDLAPRLAADLPPNGWWSRFRSLLAA